VRAFDGDKLIEVVFKVKLFALEIELLLYLVFCILYFVFWQRVFIFQFLVQAMFQSLKVIVLIGFGLLP
jgi:hypothetical protein